jgi:hypothetical protein
MIHVHVYDLYKEISYAGKTFWLVNIDVNLLTATTPFI